MLQDCDQNFSEKTIFHIQVGINNATLVPEAEAASFYCQVSPLHRINTRNGEMICLQTLGMKYLMLDLGGKILLYVIEVLVFCLYVYPLPLSFCLQMNLFHSSILRVRFWFFLCLLILILFNVNMLSNSY